MKSQIDDVLNSKINKKQFLVPLITIIAFVLVIGGVSYAYFGFNSVTNNVIYANVSTPEAVNKSLSITKTDCDLNISMENMQKGGANSFDDSCGLNLKLTGVPGDYCTYKLVLVSTGATYTPSIDYGTCDGPYECEFYSWLYFSSQWYNSDHSNNYETDINDNCFSGNINSFLTMDDLAYENKIEISTDPIEVGGWNEATESEYVNYYPVDTMEVHYAMDLSFFNLDDVDQTHLIKSTTAPTVYKYQLKVTDLECNWNH